MNRSFCIGVGRREITPPLGAYLAGYSPMPRAEAVHDPLHIIVLAVRQGEKTLLLAAQDTCNTGNSGDLVRRAMAEAAGVRFEHTSVSAVHTHSGPVTFVTPPFANPNPEYVEGILVPKAAEAAREAMENLTAAEFGIEKIHSEVAINRRQIRENGEIFLGQEPLGLYDPDMTVVSFRSAADQHCLANLVHYGCHNTGSGKISTVTRDWCGVMKDRLEALSGGVTLFLNGSEGDCGPRLANGKTVGNLQMALELGEKAAADACACWRSIGKWQGEALLMILPETVRIPYADPAAHGGETAYLLPSTLWALGDLAFVPSPFETFAETCLRIRRHSPFPCTLVTSQTNFRGGYLPTRSAYPLGGYEVDFYKRLGYGFRGEDEGFVEEMIRILRELNEIKSE